MGALIYWRPRWLSEAEHPYSLMTFVQRIFWLKNVDVPLFRIPGYATVPIRSIWKRKAVFKKRKIGQSLQYSVLTRSFSQGRQFKEIHAIEKFEKISRYSGCNISHNTRTQMQIVKLNKHIKIRVNYYNIKSWWEISWIFSLLFAKTCWSHDFFSYIIGAVQ